MGLFNTVTVAAECPWCGKRSTMDVQFKEGKLWQYRYKIGDELRWPEGKKPNLRRRIVSGIAIPCRYCVKDFIDFDIVIDKNRIESAVPRALSRAQQVRKRSDKAAAARAAKPKSARTAAKAARRTKPAN
jgi:hypothetical protein